MADAGASKVPTLSEQYLLKENIVKPDTSSKPVEVTATEKPIDASPDGVPSEESNESPVEVSTENSAPASNEDNGNAVITPVIAEEKTEASPAASDDNSEANQAVVEESSETNEQKGSDDPDLEETSGIKLETAPADFRFPTTNQSRHCFTRYVEYHRCINAKGEDAPECNKFAKYYRALCPGEWVDRWNEQRENGTFPGRI